MGYDISFKAKLEGVNQWINVGDDWISQSSNAGNMIKEVCGSYPSEWNGKTGKEMYPVLIHGAFLLLSEHSKYRCFEQGYCTVETAAYFLEKVANICKQFPTAILEVDY